MNHFKAILEISKIPYRGFRFISRTIYYAFRLKKNFFKSLYRFLKLYLKDGFTPEESYQYGLLSNDNKYESRDKYTSRKRMSYIQRKINPYSWAPLTEDKDIFYKICEKLDIPTPKLYALFYKNTPSWTFSGNRIKNKEEWNDFSVNTLPEEFLIKPARGVYGKGINIYQRSGEIFINEKNISTTSYEIYDRMMVDRVYNCFVIQERLRNHYDFRHLSNSDFLQTIRVITNIDNNYNCRIICAYLKPIVGKNIVDNQNYGRTGNLLAKIDLDRGVLQSAIFMSSKPHGIEKVTNHPDTGAQFSGFLIPNWKDVCGLAISAAKNFIPIQAIGWDIAVTQNGPYIIEGNIWWDPPKFGDMDGIISELKL